VCTKENIVLLKYPKTCMSFAAMEHIAEELCLSALLMLKVENSLFCLVSIQTASVHNTMAVYFVLQNINKK
jgi:hypothetical protein